MSTKRCIGHVYVSNVVPGDVLYGTVDPYDKDSQQWANPWLVISTTNTSFDGWFLLEMGTGRTESYAPNLSRLYLRMCHDNV